MQVISNIKSFHLCPIEDKFVVSIFTRHKMKTRILIFIFILSAASFPQGHFQSFLNRINSVISGTERQAVADSFFNYARNVRIPFVDNDTAVFLYRGNATSAAIAGDFTNWEATTQFIKIQPTNLFYYRQKFEMNARLDYKLAITNNSGTQWILDPENPHRVSGGFGPNSELAMPDYIQPDEIIYNTAIPHGIFEQKQLLSINTNKNYNITVYLPPGYNSAKHYPAVYFQDGSEYINLGSAFNVLDNTTEEHLINKVIAVFVTPTDRNEEYAGGLRNQYAAFFANELVPFIDSLYSTIKNPHMRLVMGDSYGGNISALISYYYPEVFGNCGLHSAAFQNYNYEVDSLFFTSSKKDIKFSSIWGTYEPLWQNMRMFRDSLIAKGYEFQWLEVPEGHSWGQWRANIDRIIEYIFPYGLTDVYADNKPSILKDYTLSQNYPNPFNSSTIIKFSLYDVSGINSVVKVQLKVYNLLGEEIATLVDDYKRSGNYEIRFDAPSLTSGVYFYRLTAGTSSVTKQMIYLK